MNKHIENVRKFMQLAGQETPPEPTIMNDENALLRARLNLEETLEMCEALGVDITINGVKLSMENLNFAKTGDINMVELADAVADIHVVSTGAALAAGINMEPIQDMVDQSNLDKFRGDAHRSEETGKWIKPSDWKAPDIKKELCRQREAAGCCGGKRCVC